LGEGPGERANPDSPLMPREESGNPGFDNHFYQPTMLYLLISGIYRIPNSLHFDLDDWRGWAGIMMLIIFSLWTLWSEFFISNHQSDDQEIEK